MLEARADLDDDPVAALMFALGAVEDGNPEDAWWAASRLLDAAFERVPYPEGQETFRPVAEDEQHEVVQRELSWLTEVLTLLEVNGSTADTINHLKD